MKYLLLIGLLSLTSCSNRDPEPKFIYDQKIHVYNGFFRGMDGIITSVRKCHLGVIAFDYCYTVYGNEKESFEVTEQELTK